MKIITGLFYFFRDTQDGFVAEMRTTLSVILEALEKGKHFNYRNDPKLKVSLFSFSKKRKRL